MGSIEVTLADELWLTPSLSPHARVGEVLLGKAWVTNDRGRGMPGIADPPPLLVLHPGRRIILEIACPGCIAWYTGQHDGTIQHQGHSPHGPSA